MITKPKDECRPHAPPCNKARCVALDAKRERLIASAIHEICLYDEARIDARATGKSHPT
jgi:hypothetical protein